MGGYRPTTDTQRTEMLETLGMRSVQELFADIPAALRCGELDIPDGKSEFEVRRLIEAYAGANTVFHSVFRGAGAYRHYIPAIAKQVPAKETFLTAYTPYQAEISQGVLQAIFEFQSEICALTGMAVANASVYDGASAAAEAAGMCRERARCRTLVASGVHPDTLLTVGAYCRAAGVSADALPQKDGKLDLDALKEALAGDVACLVLQSPNFWGLIEDVEAAAQLCHSAGAKLVLSVNPIALALFKTPKEYGADIAVGDAQPLGMPLAFGGPWAGYMACGEELMRRLPGRIVGQTADADGRRCFVLTLQAREQHIRREKALSSICSNQALCALTATVYLAAMGPDGMRQAAQQCYAKAHYAAGQLEAAGFKRVHEGEFFHEFLTACPVYPALLTETLQRAGILGGLVTDRGILWCCTEMNSKADIDRMVSICREVRG